MSTRNLGYNCELKVKGGWGPFNTIEGTSACHQLLIQVVGFLSTDKMLTAQYCYVSVAKSLEGWPKLNGRYVFKALQPDMISHGHNTTKPELGQAIFLIECIKLESVDIFSSRQKLERQNFLPQKISLNIF